MLIPFIKYSESQLTGLIRAGGTPFAGVPHSSRCSMSGICFSDNYRSSVFCLDVTADRLQCTGSIYLRTPKLLLHRPSKTQHISTVIGDLEGPESVVRIGQLPMHRNLPADKLCVQ